MNEPAEVTGFIIQCDHSGTVESVLRQDLRIFPPITVHQHFLASALPQSHEAARQFFSDLCSAGGAISEPLGFAGVSHEMFLCCTGIRYTPGYLIIGTPALYQPGPEPAGTSKKSGLPSLGSPDHRIYEDFSRVNNELVNMQRELIEAHMEIGMQKEELDREIRERKKIDAALHQTNHKLNLLASITRHDIKNQLLALRSYLALSKKTPGNAEKTMGFILKAEKAEQAIENQITFTKEYQDLGVNEPVWQNAGGLVKKALLALPLREIIVSTDLPGLEVYADPLFEKVFYNLIDNALRYGGPKMTSICFFMRETGGGITIICEDDGEGLSAEDKGRLFERGFGHNTGLGLFLSREILSITGITITETSEPGQGARFEMIIPIEGARSGSAML